jgi:hypothetical protein
VTNSAVDLNRLLKLRLVVARHGEMDRVGWWNTNQMLGRRGAIVVQRGLPRTHRFAQARVVFAVARARCEELFDAPGSITLWRLPADVEDQFEDRWQAWLGDPDSWDSFFDELATAEPAELLSELAAHDLISPEQTDTVQALRRSAEGRAVQLTGERVLDDDLVALLAGGFAKGEPHAPAIPYAKLAAA